MTSSPKPLNLGKLLYYAVHGIEKGAPRGVSTVNIWPVGSCISSLSHSTSSTVSSSAPSRVNSPSGDINIDPVRLPPDSPVSVSITLPSAFHYPHYCSSLPRHPVLPILQLVIPPLSKLPAAAPSIHSLASHHTQDECQIYQLI